MRSGFLLACHAQETTIAKTTTWSGLLLIIQAVESYQQAQ